MNKHTPGPWTTGEPLALFEGGSTRFHISQEDGAPYTSNYSDVAQFLAETIPGEKLEVQKANALLIAAAPDMLEALQRVVAAEKAVNSMYWDGRGGDEPAVIREFENSVDAARAAIAKATGEAP